MRVLVYCANGLQGQSIVRQLLKSGHQVRALVRDRNRARCLLKPERKSSRPTSIPIFGGLGARARGNRLRDPSIGSR